MALVESLQKTIEYMEAHLLDDITIKDIAEQAHLSPENCTRTGAVRAFSKRQMV
ncbi:hypothetical protein [Siminovitchia fordii]|uniref:HTH araC/xylS-type domain-containing protein n=1 Tax=Siminovitchia fordii TaxID=254759 RepID=A0ABQ4K3C8_9BACI|nr:hypothetical protein [Siminovitchia fordii]GIN20254.1 hypothetical protein J1TS3_13880 [Siminovitchia fordii]